VLEPEVKRAAATLRGDDVEDPAEGLMRDEERQLLIDVQRRPPDRTPGEKDGDRYGRGCRRNQNDAAGARAELAEPVGNAQLTGARPSRRASSSGGSGATRYGCSSTTWDSWYTLSALTSQMSWWAPASKLSTARIAVSIE
jgi:hypothetical protein